MSWFTVSKALLKSKNIPQEYSRSSIAFCTLSIIAELLHAEGARAEPHTLENLVTHRSQKFWLSRDCPVRQVPYHKRVALLQ